jgi:HEAT repeat protein
MPATETEIVNALLAELPELVAGKIENIELDVTDKIIAGVLANADRVTVLIDQLKEVDDGTDWRQRYMLHAISTHTAPGSTAPDHADKRRMLIAVFSDALKADRPVPIKEFAIRQLELIGGADAAALLGSVLTDKALCDPAARALTAIGDGAAAQLRAALPKVDGRRRLTVVQALGALRDAEAASALRPVLDDEDEATRLAAAWALANIGDGESVQRILAIADNATDMTRVRATDTCFVLAERLSASGNGAAARRIYNHLRESRKADGEAYIRDAAQRALQTAS